MTAVRPCPDAKVLQLGVVLLPGRQNFADVPPVHYDEMDRTFRPAVSKPALSLSDLEYQSKSIFPLSRPPIVGWSDAPST